MCGRLMRRYHTWIHPSSTQQLWDLKEVHEMTPKTNITSELNNIM
jgi:hypothetical protein